MKLKQISALILSLALTAASLGTVLADDNVGFETEEITAEESEGDISEENAEYEEAPEDSEDKSPEEINSDESEETDLPEDFTDEQEEPTETENETENQDDKAAEKDNTEKPESEEELPTKISGGSSEEKTAESPYEETTEEDLEEATVTEVTTETGSEETTEEEYGERLAAPELSQNFYLEESRNADLAEVTYADSGAAISSNVGDQNYTVYGPRIYSYLIDNGDSTLTRVEYISGTIVAETYSSEDFSLISTRQINMELSLFGGFYSGENYNFFVFGQTNYEEDDSVEVLRIVKYSKDWERLDSCGLYGENTYVPFNAGSLRMAESGDMLYIKTCHQKYESSDGLRHQSNFTIFMQISTMTAAYSEVGYVSHSFNQFIITDDTNIIALDQGDAYPRAAVLTYFYTETAGDTSPVNDTSYIQQVMDAKYINVFEFSGEDGDNYTGASFGGLEASDTSYLTAGNSIDQKNFEEEYYNYYATRNIFVTSTSKDDFSTVVNWVTDYDGDVYLSTPHLVKINDNKFLLMWTEANTADYRLARYYEDSYTASLKYVFINGEGNITSEIYSAEGSLSNCKPIVSNNKVIWYCTDNSAPLFYILDLNNPDEITFSEDRNIFYLDYSIENGEVSVTDCHKAFLPAEYTLPDTIDGCPVTSIGKLAFHSCTGLTEIIIPDSITSIGTSAFHTCTGLTEITIPNSVTSMGSSAVRNCTGLTKAVLSNNLTSIESYVFYSCTGLTEITIPDSVASIDYEAFYDCSSLTEIIIPNSVAAIDYFAFGNCTELKTAGPIGGDYNIQFGWTGAIPANAFYSMKWLTDVTIPNGITTINSYAFYNCSALNEIIIPDSIASIGKSVFYGCTGLKTAGPIGGDYNIQFGWTEIIPENAFYSIESLTKVRIPNGITTINSYAFYNCSALNEIIIPDSVSSIDSYTFYGCTELKTAGPIGGDYNIQFGWTEEIPGNTFSGNEYLTEIKIPDSITSIGFQAFSSCTGLTEITLPDNLTSIAGRVFYKCTGLTKLTIPGSVSTVGSYAFYGCTNLKTAGPVGGDYDLQFGWTEALPDNAFSNMNCLTNVTITDSITTIGEYAFENCVGLSEITIPNRVTVINKAAFYGCTGLTEITIPNRVESIGEFAFCKCSSLKNLELPTDITLIETSFCNSCSSLESITIPDKVTKINANAFKDCANLTSITIPNSVKSINSTAFLNSGLTTVYCYKNSTADNSSYYPDGTEIIYIVKVMPPTFGVAGVFGGRNVTFTSDTDADNVKIYYSASTSNITEEDLCVENGETVLFENFYGTIYAKAYYNGKWSEASRLILKIPVVNTPTVMASGSTVTIKSTTPSSFICYTTDGSEPVVETDGTLTNGTWLRVNGARTNSGTITANPGDTVRAAAVRNCFTTSESAAAYVNVSPAAFKVVGTFGGRNVTFTSDTSGAKIYYSSTTSSLTTEDKCVENGETVLFEDFYGTIYARAYYNGKWSNVSRLILKIPTINDPTITYSGGKATIRTTTPSCYIYYTTDGSTPSITNGKKLCSNSYGQVSVSSGTTIKAIAVRSCFTNSTVISYTVS